MLLWNGRNVDHLSTIRTLRPFPCIARIRSQSSAAVALHFDEHLAHSRVRAVGLEWPQNLRLSDLTSVVFQ